MNRIPTIGLEVHAELSTARKMFCGCKNDSDETHPNTNVCPVCLAHPGALPVPNEEAIKKMIAVGIAVGGTIAHSSQFDRKNYFYPDQPKGYQISQYEHPFVKGGVIALPSSGKRIRITRVHLEEDTGSLLHDASGATLVDFNRSGIPLMELVTEPDVSSAEEAAEFATELQLLLRTIGASHARMDKGEMRVEANVSVAPEGAPYGTKVEIKNINSFKSVARAIAYEITRQDEELDAGKPIIQSTRGWDEVKQVTIHQRTKESAHDYRYFPEPDIPVIRTGEATSLSPAEIGDHLPELPQEKRARFASEYGVAQTNVELLIRDSALATFFEQSRSELSGWLETANAGGDATERAVKLHENYVFSDILGIVTEKEIPWGELRMTAENYAELITMIATDKLSSRGGKDLLRILVLEGGDPSEIVEKRGLAQTSDTRLIDAAIMKIAATEASVLAEWKGGKDKALQFLVGQTMRAVKEKGSSANPSLVRERWKALHSS